MAGLITIELKQLRFFAFHGLHSEERKTGNTFGVNLAVSYVPASLISKVSSTIDYAGLYHLVSEKMKQPEDLLETLAMQIAADIHSAYPQVKHIAVEISKLYAPITGFQGEVSVRYAEDY